MQPSAALIGLRCEPGKFLLSKSKLKVKRERCRKLGGAVLLKSAQG